MKFGRRRLSPEPPSYYYYYYYCGGGGGGEDSELSSCSQTPASRLATQASREHSNCWCCNRGVEEQQRAAAADSSQPRDHQLVLLHCYSCGPANHHEHS